MLYKFEKIENCRDLGGIKTKDGHIIKDRVLFRCGGLFSATATDKKKLEELKLDLIVDLRSFEEVNEKPDFVINGTKYVNLRVNEESMQGVSREEKNKDGFFDRMIESSKTNPNAFVEHMSENYRKLISSKYSNNIYSELLNLLADENNQKVLWHCTAGKDRTGIASIIILEILNVDKKTIYENYLETNKHLKESTAELIKTVYEKVDDKQLAEEIAIAFKKAMSADVSFIDAAYDEMIKMAGSVEKYLENNLKVDKVLREKLQNKYLIMD